MNQVYQLNIQSKSLVGTSRKLASNTPQREMPLIWVCRLGLPWWPNSSELMILVWYGFERFAQKTKEEPSDDWCSFSFCPPSKLQKWRRQKRIICWRVFTEWRPSLSFIVLFLLVPYRPWLIRRIQGTIFPIAHRLSTQIFISVKLCMHVNGIFEVHPSRGSTEKVVRRCKIQC